MNHSLLHGISAADCNAAWEALKGSDTVRFCPICKRHVYRAPDETALRKLITETEPDKAKTSTHLFRRADGTFMLSRGICAHAPLLSAFLTFGVIVLCSLMVNSALALLNMCFFLLVFAAFELGACLYPQMAKKKAKYLSLVLLWIGVFLCAAVAPNLFRDLWTNAAFLQLLHILAGILSLTAIALATIARAKQKQINPAHLSDELSLFRFDSHSNQIAQGPDNSNANNR